ncbi:MAG: hypothetical protein QOF53_3235 [Nocardioidaceae bacterium]|nr:hypothetical protein [Nocardioidaceae bacterium]
MSNATQEWEGTQEWESAHEWEGGAHEWEGGAQEWEGGAHEWEGGAHEWEGTHEWEGGAQEWEADPFLPLAALALPLLKKFALPAIKRLIPVARRAIGSAVRGVLAPPPPAGQPFRPLPSSVGRARALRLLSELRGIVLRGEAEAEAAEAAMFGNAEFEWEVSSGPQANEMALTEVLAAEAAHTASEAEASALLGAALPVTIRIMGGRRALRRITPGLVVANAQLVRGLHRSGPSGPQLLRLVPTIQRRTVASLAALQRSGRPLRVGMVPPIMAAQTARVLATPRITGPTLARNTFIRQQTTAPARRQRA